MNKEYVNQVRRSGSHRPYVDENGQSYNLRHETDFRASLVLTDGKGNVTDTPLLRRKPCFGRPERVVRGAFEVAKGYVDSDGVSHSSFTRCGNCKIQSPGVFKACGRVSDERIGSSPSVEAALTEWLRQCDLHGLDPGKNAAYAPPLAKYWLTFLSAIIAHGGWFNINDENVRWDNQQRAAAERERRNAAKRKKRERERGKRRGTIKPVTPHFERSLEAERDRRAAQLKRLRCGPAAGRSLSRQRDENCDRMADVWQGRELLKRQGKRPTGTAIAKWMIGNGRNYGLELGSLTTRVCEDLRNRIPAFEDDRGGSPVWPEWEYDEP